MAGRPSLYKEEYAEQLLQLMQQGKKGAHLFSHFGVSRRTFYQWLGKHEDFKDAYERGWEECEAYWERVGMRMIEEKDERGFKPWIAMMNHNFGWAKNQTEQQGGTQINIGNVNVFQEKTNAELIQEIQGYLEDLNVIDVKFEAAPEIPKLEKIEEIDPYGPKE